ncbi:MAG: hypothetical protein ACRC33_25070 [Gemmataceae bacterium]
MNLGLAILWLLAGVGVMAYEAAVGPLRLRLFGTVSAGWFCLVLSAYNFVRWYARRSARADEQAERLVEAARSRRRADRPRDDPDPTFDFTDRPPSNP